MNKFKAGDKVYYPSRTTQICTLEYSDDDARHPLVIRDESFSESFTRDGYEYSKNLLPSVFHVTEENCKKLSELYDIEFEPPLKPKLPRDIIQAMLDDGWHSVPVYYTENKEGTMGYAFKTYIAMNARPFDPKTGKVIIDYVDSKIILED